MKRQANRAAEMRTAARFALTHTQLVIQFADSTHSPAPSQLKPLPHSVPAGAGVPEHAWERHLSSMVQALWSSQATGGELMYMQKALSGLQKSTLHMLPSLHIAELQCRTTMTSCGGVLLSTEARSCKSVRSGMSVLSIQP